MRNILNFCMKKKVNLKLFHMIGILFLAVSLTYLVYITGGTKHSYTNLMYIPIIMSVFVYGVEGGILISLISGFLLGPYMPEDVKLGIMQNPINWLNRLGIYIVICLTLSLIVNHNKKLTELVQKKAYEDPGTGLPNVNKLTMDLNEILEKKIFESYTIAGFVFENMQQINRYVDFEIGGKSHNFLLNSAAESFKGYPLYSIYRDEFIVIFPNIDLERTYEMVEIFMRSSKEIKYFDGVPVNFILKCGIVNFPYHGKDDNDILKKLGRAMDQAKSSDSNIAIYNDYLANVNLENYNILISFSEALKKGRLTLNYQPKIDMRINRVVGVEALLRWKDFQERNVSIDKIIKIIEDAGFVNQLTKWVVRKVIRQISEWHKLGLNISVSLNLSGKDLNNRTLINYTKKYIERYGVNPSYIEFELTERTIIENDGKAVDILNDFKNMGLKISIDDYGTGSNSLMNMLSLPIDCIKIDKYFIHNMIHVQGIKLIEDIINLIHNLGKEVCAEGVETVEQLQLLREMGCDYVQGFYFSKPVSVEEVPSVIRRINNNMKDDIKNVFEDIS